MEQKSWYVSQRKFSEEESIYLETLQMMFNMRNQRGDAIKYAMTDYQKEYHADSLNIKGENSKDILFVKARGISFSYSSLIDLIYTGMTFDNQLLPIICQRYDSSKLLLDVAKWLIRNANIDMGRVEIHETAIRFLDTNTVMRPYPSGTASDAIRGSRLLRCMIDEFAFQRRDRELLAAVQDTMQGKLKQILIGSTPAGIKNEFYKLTQNPIGFTVFRLPVFDEKKFNPNLPIPEQSLIPIAPWIDLDNLEIKRRRDVNIFLQENMTNFLDDSISFISFSLVKRCENKDLINYLDNWRKSKEFIYSTPNPIVIGVDVARTTHLTAISAFELMKDEDGKETYVQRLLLTIKNMEIPKQVDLIDSIVSIFPTCLQVRVDMTGLGIGLYEYLKKKRGAMIRGISFSYKMRTGEPRQKFKIREYMLVNFKNLMENAQVELLVDETQQAHLTSMNYEFKVKEDETGHGDILFANALATLPADYSMVASEPLMTTTVGGKPKVTKDRKEWTLQDRIDWLKNQRPQHHF